MARRLEKLRRLHKLAADGLEAADAQLRVLHGIVAELDSEITELERPKQSRPNRAASKYVALARKLAVAANDGWVDLDAVVAAAIAATKSGDPTPEKGNVKMALDRAVDERKPPLLTRKGGKYRPA